MLTLTICCGQSSNGSRLSSAVNRHGSCDCKPSRPLLGTNWATLSDISTELSSWILTVKISFKSVTRLLRGKQGRNSLQLCFSEPNPPVIVGSWKKLKKP